MSGAVNAKCLHYKCGRALENVQRLRLERWGVRTPFATGTCPQHGRQTVPMRRRWLSYISERGLRRVHDSVP
jgi:hypothetical protein